MKRMPRGVGLACRACPIALACVLGFLGCIDGEPSPNVILVSVDTLRADALGS